MHFWVCVGQAILWVQKDFMGTRETREKEALPPKHHQAPGHRGLQTHAILHHLCRANCLPLPPVRWRFPWFSRTHLTANSGGTSGDTESTCFPPFTVVLSSSTIIHYRGLKERLQPQIHRIFTWNKIITQNKGWIFIFIFLCVPCTLEDEKQVNMNLYN